MTTFFHPDQTSVFSLRNPDTFSSVSGLGSKLNHTSFCAHLLPRFSLNSELHNHQPTLVTVISGEEEHFEDFGENNTSELLLENSVEGPEGKVASPLVKSPEQVNGSSLLSPRYETQL